MCMSDSVYLSDLVGTRTRKREESYTNSWAVLALIPEFYSILIQVPRRHVQSSLPRFHGFHVRVHSSITLGVGPSCPRELCPFIAIAADLLFALAGIIVVSLSRISSSHIIAACGIWGSKFRSFKFVSFN